MPRQPHPLYGSYGWLPSEATVFSLVSKPELGPCDFIMPVYFLKDANSKNLQGKRVKEHRGHPDSVSEK